MNLTVFKKLLKTDMNKSSVLIIAFLAIIAIAFAAETKGIGCSLCKDFVKEMEKELANEEGTIEEVGFCDSLKNCWGLIFKCKV